jgi:LCP family protein required for cell wall assembly
MASRPPGKGGPEEGTPEYNWLYGSSSGTPPDDATRAVPQQPQRPRDDATRMMPAASAGESSSAGGSGPSSTSKTYTSRPSMPRPLAGRRVPRPRLGWLKIVLLLWLVFLLAVPFWAWSRVDKVDAMPDGDRPGDQGGTTYLLVGSDSRDGLSEEERRELGTGGAVGQRTDTIMLLHTGDGPNLLMSVPRDSIVTIPGRGEGQKVNAAYAYGGPKLLVRTLEAETGIRIDHYVEIGFGGFVGMVDALGGVEICPQTAMKDPQANLDVKKGCQEADGATALGYARSRKTYAQLGDIDRARAQREVVSAIGSEALSPWSVVNPWRYWNLNMASADSFRVSEGTSPFSFARFAFAMTRVNGENGLTCGVPIADTAVNWDAERSEQMFGYIRDDATSDIPDSLCTPSGLPQ